MSHEERYPFNRDALDLRLLKLARFRHVPDDVLCELVTRDGLCFWVFDRDEMPEPVGDEDTDRRLAAYMCEGCPVADECLELEFRAAGEHTAGVWGGLSESDRRAIYAAWRWYRDNPDDGRARGGG